jgi:hypothetical protein
VEVGGSGPDARRGDGARAGSGPAAPETADQETAKDRVAAAAAELYGVDTEAFAERRKELATSARAAGDKSAATAIAALRKPTRAAWVVNRLARADPGAPPRLAAVAAGLLAAERAKDGPRLRELSATRGALIDALTGFPDPPPSLRAEVSATLTAALADPEVAAAFAVGTLTRAVHWSGFGAADLAPAGAADSAPASKAAPTDPSAPDGRAPADDVRLTAGRAQPRGVPAERAAHPPAPPRPPGRVAARVAAAEEQRLVREAAERATRDRNNYEAAERTVAASATAAAEAVAAEDRLEAQVRDLEERLTQARVDLTAARLSARRAEAAERRARQVRDRLPGP